MVTNVMSKVTRDSQEDLLITLTWGILNVKHSLYSQNTSNTKEMDFSTDWGSFISQYFSLDNLVPFLISFYGLF